MNSAPSPYLKVTRLALTQRGISSTSSCSTLTHSTGPMPSGKSKVSGSLNGGRGVPAAVFLVDHRRVEALLDRGPDGERGREGGRPVRSVDHEVCAVANADLVDLAEEVVCGVAGEDVGQAGLDPDADESQPTGLLPLRGGGELLVSELHPGQLVRLRRMRAGQRHRHVQVVAAGGERAVEDGQHEPAGPRR